MVLKMLISLRDCNIMPTFAKQLRNNINKFNTFNYEISFNSNQRVL